MRLKSPHRPGRRLATLLAAGALTLGMSSYAAVLTAGPASADPVCQEVAVGSDTIQDVMNQYALDLGGSALCSYDATDPVTGAIPTSGGPVQISYVKGLNPTEPTGPSCATYERPDGSSSGLEALQESINPTTTATPALVPAPALDCVDIGRSSSGPAVNPAGELTYIPFAEDAVTDAVGPATAGTVQGVFGPVVTVATQITDAGLFTQTDLEDLYASCEPVTVGSPAVTYYPWETGATVPGGDQRIDLYVPQSGSGTLKFWEQTLGIPTTGPLPACDFQIIQQGAYAGTTPTNGTAVEEHDGLAVATDMDGIMPFSIAQWISQSVHTTGDPVDIDRRYGAQLQDVVVGTTQVAPYTTSASGALKLNGAFPFNRLVYNIVEGCRVDSTDPNVPSGIVVNGVTQTCSVDSFLQGMLVGQGGSLCSDLVTIANYGFDPLFNNPNETATCGLDTSAFYAVPTV
jgi:hypothetical protein